MTDKIPKWALRTTLLFSLPISGAALYLTRTYGIDNLAALNLDTGAIFVRRLSIDVLLAAHVAAFFIIALLPDSAFKFRRWQLRILALAIWAFDGTMIFQARLGIMQGADSVQVSAAARVVDQRAAIKGLQESAAAMRLTAARQMANKMITAGAVSQKEAARLEAKAAEMSEKLASMPSGAGVTEIKTVGWFAPYKAAIESALISFVSLIMLGLAGLSARMLLDGRERPALPAPVKPRPAPAPDKVSYSTRALRGLGVLTGGAAAVAAPVAHSAPSAPAKPAPGAPACTPADAGALMPAAPVTTAKPASAPDVPAPKSAPVEPAPAASGTPAQVQQVQSAEPGVPGKVQAQSVRRELPDGVREAVRSGTVKPTQLGMKSLGVGQGYAAKWLAQLCAEGITERDGRGYKLKGGVA